MRIGICDGNDNSQRQLQLWIQSYCAIYETDLEIVAFRNAEDLFFAASLRRFGMVFLGIDGSDGFLSARRLRDMDKQVKLVFISDTDRYAVNGVRLHFIDYIVRPVEFRHIVRSMRLAGIPGEIRDGS